jgi:hypothetical protein
MDIKKPLKIILKSKEKDSTIVKPFSLNKKSVNYKQKMVLYSPEIKKLFKSITGMGKNTSPDYVPGAMVVIHKHLNSSDKFSLKYTDPKGRFVINSVSINTMLPSNIHKAYKLDIFENNKTYSFYIKAIFENTEFKQSTQKIIIQKFMEKKGFNVIRPKFAFSEVNTEVMDLRLIESKKCGFHFIVYDYTNLKNVYDSYLLKEITSKDYIAISKKLDLIKISFSNEQIRDIVSKNVYYEKIKNKFNSFNIYKLFISDLYLIDLDKKILAEFAKKEDLVK